MTILFLLEIYNLNYEGNRHAPITLSELCCTRCLSHPPVEVGQIQTREMCYIDSYRTLICNGSQVHVEAMHMADEIKTSHLTQ